jgi:hypothetical protein
VALTSSLFSWLTIVLGLGVVALTIWIWPRLASKKIATIASSVGLILLCQVLALLSVGVNFNRSQVFYASWSDLVGGTGGYTIAATVPVPIPSVSGSQLNLPIGQATSSGGLITDEIVHGTESAATGHIITLLPREFVNAARGKKLPAAFPGFHVIEFFPGYPGVPDTWLHALDLVKIIETAQNNHDIGPTIAVIPAITVKPRQDTECLDFAYGPKVETWLTVDVPAYVKSRFAISVPHWGVTGYSTGGWCAAMIGMLHPDRYVATGVIAGYFRPQIGISVSGSEFNSLQSKYNLLSLAKNHPPATNVMVVTSAQDRAGRADSLQFIAAARPPLVVTQLSLLKGGHNTIVWRGIEPELFKWFGKILDADPQSLGAWSSGG